MYSFVHLGLSQTLAMRHWQMYTLLMYFECIAALLCVFCWFGILTPELVLPRWLSVLSLFGP